MAKPYLLRAHYKGQTYEPHGWTATHTYERCTRTWWVHLTNTMDKVKAAEVEFTIDGKPATAIEALRYCENYCPWD